MSKTLKILLFLFAFIFVSTSAFAQTISITPIPADDDDALTCRVDGVNDPFYIYQWDKLGVSDTPIIANPLAASNTNPGDNWRCKVIIPSFPSDIPLPGYANVTISGEEPSTPSVEITITPDPAYDDDDLTCLADGENDPDYIYEWDRVGVADIAIEANPLDASETSPGQTWRCKLLLPSSPADTPIPGDARITIQEEAPPAVCDDPDSDGYGIGNQCRGTDNCPSVRNTNQSNFDDDASGDACDDDDDLDGVEDSDDNCPRGDGDAVFESLAALDRLRDQDPNQADFDGDGLGDLCDPDDDDDDVNDDNDICPIGDGDDAFEPQLNAISLRDQNPSQTNTDEDDFGNICDVDDDNDGVDDGPDNCNLVSNPSQENLDDGSAGDACDDDDDNDGLTDTEDNCPLGNGDDVFDVLDTNPDQTDSDGNGDGDVCDASFCLDPDLDGRGAGLACLGPDNCPDDYNPDQEDVDADGAGDACDDDAFCSDPDGDVYGVGVACLGADNCPSDFNPDQDDADGDGIGNACDADDDGDVVGDVDDNCPADFNPGQEDADADGIGDACDDAIACFDIDGDFYGSGTECLGPDNCPENANPTQANFDGDAAGDACDTDNDNDGLTDTEDNCPLGDGDIVYEFGVDDNADQSDADGNGVGNLCDVPDTEAPTVLLNTPENGNVLSSSTVDFTYFVTDNIDVVLSCTLFTDTSGIFQDDLTQTAHHVLFDELSGFTDLNTFTLTGIPDGTYTWNVECVDTAGNSAFAPDDFTFTVDTSVPPVNGTIPHVSIEAEPTHGEAPLDVSFGALVQDGDGALRFFWDFGDGVTSTKRSPLHYYEEEGTYTARLVVTDADGDVDTAAVIIAVGGEDIFTQEDKLSIRRILLASPAGNEVVYGGDELLLRLTMENTGHEELEDVRVSIAIPDLGVRRSDGSFDLSIGESETATVRLDIPWYAEPDMYTVHIRVGNDDVQRFRNRVVWVVEP